jgi:hypothetical protein
MYPHVHGEECGLIDLPALVSDRRPRTWGRDRWPRKICSTTGGRPPRAWGGHPAGIPSFPACWTDSHVCGEDDRIKARSM